MALNDDMNALAAQISNLGMSIANKKDGKVDVKKTKELFDYQQEKNLQYNKDINEQLTKPYYQWQLLNQPKLNVQGLQAAGINPLMVYGSNTGISGADSMASPPSGDVGNVLNAFENQRSNSIQSALASADIAKTFTEIKSMSKDIQQKESFNKFAEQLYQGEAKTAEGNSLLVQTEIDYKKADIKQVKSLTNQLDAATQNLNAQTANAIESLNLLRQQGKINDATINNIIADTSVKLAQSIREEFGINLDRQQLTNLQQSLHLMILQGHALAPASAIAGFLNNGNNAHIYAKSWLKNQVGLGNINFGIGEQNKITTSIKTGNFISLSKESWQQATQGYKGPLKFIVGSAAVGQQVVNLITTNVGSLLNDAVKAASSAR